MEKPLSKEQQRAMKFIRQHGGMVSGLKLYDHKVMRTTIRALMRRGLIEQFSSDFVGGVRLTKKGGG